MKRLIALLCGLVFGAGLALSGMTSPARVIGFLDVTGHWDPSLAFVMGGALLVAAPLFALARKRETAARGSTGATRFPSPVVIDRRLIGGSAVFGLGWGLAGICPGPALVDLVLVPLQAGLFILPMVAGLLLSRPD